MKGLELSRSYYEACGREMLERRSVSYTHLDVYKRQGQSLCVFSELEPGRAVESKIVHLCFLHSYSFCYVIHTLQSQT